MKMSKCNTCIYRAAKGQLWKCEYISIMGHSRGCEPDDKCVVYKRGRRLPIPNVSPICTKYFIEQELSNFLRQFK